MQYEDNLISCTSGPVFRAHGPQAPVTYCNTALPVVRLLDYLQFQLLLKNRLMDFDETWYRWITQGPVQLLLVFDRAKFGNKLGVFLQRTSFSYHNQMHSNDLMREEKLLFLVPFQVKYWMRFWWFFSDVIILFWFTFISEVMLISKKFRSCSFVWHRIFIQNEF